MVRHSCTSHVLDLNFLKPHASAQTVIDLENKYSCTGHSPDLNFQELHVPVEVGVGIGQDAYRLHPCTSLNLTLNRHVFKTGQPIQIIFSEISERQ